MPRSRAVALALASSLLASLASAQTTILVQSPPPVIVVIEPPPPPIVVVVAPPAPAPAPSPAPGPGPRFVLDATGDFLVLDGPAIGGSLRGGFTFGGGITAQLAAAYASGLEHGDEASLGIELQRDFSPEQPLGFLLLGRLGTTFLLDDRDVLDPGIRLNGQVGIGGRFDVSNDIAFLVDVRAVLRFRPDDPFVSVSNDFAAGVLLTFGVRFRL
jgi:hypothetical protein